MLEKAYSPEAVEKKWLAAWKKAGVGRARVRDDGRKAYTIVIPPPNVTGALHIGHALNNTLQDVLIRWKKLLGDEACWVPGTDHGGIATQNVMEKQLKSEGRTRQDLGRGRFLDRMREWTRQCQGTILGQLDRLGCSLDTERLAFTMDEKRAHSVTHAFEALFREKLIYRGERMVNWCVRCRTALSDIEVEHEEHGGKLWHIRYPFSGQSGYLVVATTRPETLLGDTAVAVNPKDPRYTAMVGRKIALPLTDSAREIPVIADDHVDASFGTGALKVTPAHDPNDFEIWMRHLEEMQGPLQVIDHAGKMSAEAGAGFQGLSREKAREKIVAELEAKGLLEKVEDHRHSVGICYRCQQVIEPFLSDQWFMEMKPLAERALGALEEERFRLWPDSWEGPYRDWLENIKDWCLSRQIWWGHRVPVWYCVHCLGDKILVSWPDKENLRAGESLTVKFLHSKGIPLKDIDELASFIHVLGVTVAHGESPGLAVQVGKPGACKDCGNFEWFQDPDVLDTWFSSALWPLSVFGWPEPAKDLRYFYPTSTLVTGYEILFLWVARMQMMGLHFTGKAPFRDAVIHGIVRDKGGKKMSKSLGNVVDPLLMMEAHGTDAFRFSLVRQAHPGRDIPYAEDSIKGSRNFANKIWNSTRFVLMGMREKPARVGTGQEVVARGQSREEGWELADYWIVSEFNAMHASVHSSMERFELAAAADAVYGFLWDKFCDWYIELAKLRLTGSDGPGKEAAREVLVGVLTATLKLLHPFMPYLTEELYAALKPYNGESADFLSSSRLPEQVGNFANLAVDPAPMRSVMEAVTAIRTLRSQLNVPPALKIRVLYSGKGSRKEKDILSQSSYLERLARVESLSPLNGGVRPAHSATAVAGDVTFYVPLAGVVDFEKEKRRLAKDLDKLSAELGKLDGQLSNEAFLRRAPESEVARLRGRSGELRGQLASLGDTLRALGGV